MSEIAPKRPGVVLAAAILLFLFGGVSILGICAAPLPYLTQAMPQQPIPEGNQPPFVDPMPKLLAEEPNLVGVSTGFTIVEALIGVAKIFAGIGVLRLRPSARKFGIVLAYLTILLTLAEKVFSALYFMPAYLRIFVRENALIIVDIQGVVEGVLWVFTGFSALASIAVWVIVIFLLNSQRARNAFAGIADTPVDELNPEPQSRYSGYEDDDGYPDLPPNSPDETGITDRPHNHG